MAVEISNVDELQAVTLDQAADYVLVNDIDATATAGWNSGAGFAPLGWYTGVFDGNFFRVIGLTMVRDSNELGLFTRLFGTCRNLTLTDAHIECTGGNRIYHGIMAGAIDGGTFTDCKAEGIVISPKDSGVFAGGTLAPGGGSFVRCGAEGIIQSNVATTGPSRLCGFTGFCESTTTNYTDCYAQVTFNIANSFSQRAWSHNDGTNNYTRLWVAPTDTNDSLDGVINTAGVTITDGFFLDESLTNPPTSEAGITRLNSVARFQMATYTGWDIVTKANHDGQLATATWFIDEGNDYPRLWFEYEHTYNELFGLGTYSQDAALVVSFPLQETSGTTYGDKKVGSSRTITPSSSYVIANGAGQGPNGYLPNAAVQEGSGSGWLPFSSSFTIGDRTYLAWVYWNSDINNVGLGQGIVAGQFYSGGWWNSFRNHRRGGGDSVFSQAEARYDISGGNLTPSQWLRLALTHDGANCVFYNHTSGFRQSISNVDTTNNSILGLAAANHLGQMAFQNGMRIAGAAIFNKALSHRQISEVFGGPEPVCTVDPTLTINASSWTGVVGTWEIDQVEFPGGNNGTITYAWELRDADDHSVVESGTGSSPSGSGSYSGSYYLRVRASNLGGYDPAQDSVSATVAVGAGPTDLAADPITSGTPVLDATSLTSTTSLAADTVTSGIPVLDSVALTSTTSLSADLIVAGTPVVDASSLTSTTSLAADAVTSGTPVLDAASIDLDISLAADEVLAGTPVIDAANLSYTTSLAADAIISGIPVLDASALTATTSLVADLITSGIPVLDPVTIESDNTLAADPVTSGVPVLDQTSLTATTSLQASAVVSGVPVLDPTSLTSTTSLAADGVLSGVPVLDAAEILGSDTLIADPVVSGIPVLDASSISYTASLVADAVLAGVPVIDATSLIIVDNQRPLYMSILIAANKKLLLRLR